MPTHERLPIELFPPPHEIRKRISANIVEARFLRRLLRVAEDAADERNLSRQFAQQQAASTQGGISQ
jgi:hypothetical protein